MVSMYRIAAWFVVMLLAARVCADTSVAGYHIVVDSKPFFPFGVYFEHAGNKERHIEGFLTYQAVIAGAKGLIPYTFAFSNQSHPELWKQQVQLRKEIEAISPELMLGEYRRMPVDPAKVWVFSACWKRGKKAIIAAVNTSAASIEPFSWTLPDLRDGQITSLFGKPSLSLQNGQLVGKLLPLSVCVCEIELAQ